MDTYNVVLCQLAERVIDGSVDENCIEFENNLWRILEPLRCIWKELNSLLDNYCLEISSKRNASVSLVLVADKTSYLHLKYVDNIYKKSENKEDFINIIPKLFPILYKNYEEVITIDRTITETNERKILKTYVTTKLYELLYRKHLNSMPSRKLEKLNLPTKFKPILCAYQERSIQWLLEREQAEIELPPYFNRFDAVDNKTVIYKHMFSENIQWEKPDVIKLPCGGILADEMGLGKTVEILALILLHQKNIKNTTIQLQEDPVSKRRRPLKDLFCICNSKLNSNLIKCSKCSLWQHRNCVEKFNSQHEETINTPYICPSCWNSSTVGTGNLLETGATFIITPNIIRTQWLREIEHHIQPTLRVLIYNGVANKWISPRQLANYDVVVTDYTVLRNEVYHTNENTSSRVTRNKPRSMRMYTPLLMLQWWRVCLDEAQMVESNTSKVASLVKLLPAVNRWAVTGTPIQRTIDDLRPLLEFVGFNSVCESNNVWKNLVNDFLARYEIPDEPLPLINILQNCMWRTCKSKVIHELNLPPQTEMIHNIELSNLEKLFYIEQHTECRTNFFNKVEKYSDTSNKLISISPHLLTLILQPLLKIRQCCTVPVVSVGSGGSTGGYSLWNGQISHKMILQPNELHKHLQNCNESECKTELRSMASSFNGLASLYFIQKQYNEAVKCYKQVLKLAADYVNMNITVDSLLQIHALHNMLQANSSCDSDKSTELTPELIKQYELKCSELEWKYLEPYANVLAYVRQNAEEIHEKLENIEVEKTIIEFISDIPNIVSSLARFNVLQEQLMTKIQDECGSSFFDNLKLSEVHSFNSLIYFLSMWYDKITSLKNNLHSKLEDLKFFTNNIQSRANVEVSIWRDMRTFILSVYDCHLSDIRNVSKDSSKKNKQNEEKSLNQIGIAKKQVCQLCNIEIDINNYECLIYAKKFDEETNQMEGTARTSVELTILKIVLNFIKSKNEFQQYNSNIEKYLELLENLELLYKKYSKYWIEIEYTVKAYDELDMCKMRMTLTEKNDDTSLYKIARHQVDQLFQEISSNLYLAEQNFITKYRRLRYIIHLGNNADPGICPICQNKIEERYTVLECGHNVCWVCVKDLRRHSNTRRVIICAMCRNEQRADKIYYVVCTPANQQCNGIEDKIACYSSKITYIIHLVMRLKREHEKNREPLKILIFSQWAEILQTIATAFKTEMITYRLQHSIKDLDEFKNPDSDITCLLMPVARGSKGLNLIESTHVFLVEPILNPSEELQAIGRVHRFGQTRPTTVHRFIVKNTIEENIHELVTAGIRSKDNWDFKNITLTDLMNLFYLQNNVIDDNESETLIED